MNIVSNLKNIFIRNRSTDRADGSTDEKFSGTPKETPAYAGMTGDATLKKEDGTYPISSTQNIVPTGSNDPALNLYEGLTSVSDDKAGYSKPFLQYKYYADIQRDYEDRNDLEGLRENQKHQLTDPHSNLDESKIAAQSALRRATKYSVFFLITTDILGPSNAPYAMRQLGLVPGIILYIAFGVFAMIGGKMLNYVFLKLDSDNYPMRTFSDVSSRLLGPHSRFFVAGLQFIQMILNVGIICLTTAQSLAQSIKSTSDDPKLCFTIQVLVWALLGMIVGQIRSLKDFSHLANSAVWMNIAICIITMVGAGTGGPNYEIGKSQYNLDPGPVKVFAVLPTNGPFASTLYSRIQGIDQMVFAWGGATIFCEVMSEMGRPREFVKGLVGADTLIMFVYLFYGIFVYCFQGQYTYAVANQGINSYGLQLASNILNIICGMLAAVLYSNVGLKVFYQGFGVPDLKFPHLHTLRGALLWAVLVVVYWAVAFIIGAAIPQVASLSALVGSLCILNFSYTLPALFLFTYLLREDASYMDKFDHVTGAVEKYDTWKSKSRWARGITTGSWKRQGLKFASFLMFLCGLTLCGLGLYGAIEGLIDAYTNNNAVAFSCSPSV